MSIPAEYQWLSSTALQPLPKVIQVALSLLGVQEVVGRGSNRTIIGWRDELNIAGHQIVGYSDDDIPWCGLFVDYVCFKAGKAGQPGPLWARNWAKYGQEVATRKAGRLVFAPGMKASLGDVMVYERQGGGGHVEFYIAETAAVYVGIGGNKSNRVMIGPMAKGRCIAIRRPLMNSAPASVRPFILNRVGGTVTTNEA